MSVPVMYSILVTICLIFVKISEYYQRNPKISNFFWYLTVTILVLVMGLRAPGVGVDDLNYLNMYNLANNVGMIDYYQIKNTEIGYYILNRVVGLLFNNYQVLIFIVSFIIVFFNMEALRYRNRGKYLTFSVFVFLCLSFLYLIGLNRIGIAIAIISYSYKFIIEGNKKKFFYFVLIASTFHYSSLIVLFLLLEKQEDLIRNVVIKNFLYIFIGFLFIRLFMYPFLNESKYQGYIDSTGGIGSVLTSIPFILIFMVVFSKIKQEDKIFKQSLILYFASISIELLSGLVGFERVVWFFRISMSDLIPRSITFGKELIFKYLLFIVFVSYLVFYCYSSYFVGYRAEYLLQYKFFFK